MELKFRVDTKHRKDWFTGISFSHPAKMSLPLQLWIIDNYTKEGEVILDPMAGSGTIMVACSMGRNVICVELEEKFCKMMAGNWEKIQQRGPQLGFSMGWAKIIQGDARNLQGLIADAIISSPPYEGSVNVPNSKPDARAERLEEAGYNPKDYQGGTGRNLQQEWSYHPKADAIISSPPYEKGMSGPSREPFWERLAKDPTSKRFGRESHPTIGQGYDEADAIITSPPYAEAQSGGGIAQKGYQGSKHSPTDLVGKRSYMPEVHGESSGQIGNLPYGNIDAVITSPPYENQIHKGSGEWAESLAGRLLGGAQSNGGKMLGVPQGKDYIESKDNIGNLKSDSYLQAMLQVYSECYRVLKPEGLMVLVTKDFIRDRKRIDLAGDTIKLCEQAGFHFVERHYRKLSAMSFWRVIYYQKNPEVERLDTEDILVLKKSGS